MARAGTARLLAPPYGEAASLADQAYYALRELIVSLELAPGSAIKEPELTAQLGIGRTPVREALRRLALERLVEVYPRRGMFGTYSSSKTALNAITVAFAADLESAGIKVNAACPGFTATDLNNFEGTRTVRQAAREPVRLALLDANGPTGTCSNDDGPLPW